VLARRVIEHNRMVLALMWTNVLKINISAASAQNVSTDLDHMNVYAHQDTVEMHIMANVLLPNDVVQQIVNVERMKNVFNQENVFAHHHSFWTPVTVTNVKIHANDMHVELMPSVHLPIHHNVCAKLDSRVTHCKVALMKMNVPLMEIHAHMGPNVSIKKEDTSVFVQMEWLEIHIKEDVLRIQ